MLVELVLSEYFLHQGEAMLSNTITAFCSYQAILYDIGSLFISSNPNTSFNLRAITTNEYESLHCPASNTLGIPPISPK